MSAVPKTLTDADEFQLRKAKKLVSGSEWTKELTVYLSNIVVRNYFNFEMIAIEMN
jgi:hypothetical protein